MSKFIVYTHYTGIMYFQNLNDATKFAQDNFSSSGGYSSEDLIAQVIPHCFDLVIGDPE